MTCRAVFTAALVLSSAKAVKPNYCLGIAKGLREHFATGLVGQERSQNIGETRHEYVHPGPALRTAAVSVLFSFRGFAPTRPCEETGSTVNDF